MNSVFIMGGSDGQPPVPPNIYDAIFVGWERKPKTVWNNTEMEEAIMFRFQITVGPYKDSIAYNHGPLNPTPKNVSGRLMIGLNGGEVKQGDKIDLDSFIGKAYQIVVENNKAGRPVVTRAIKK